MTTQTLIDTIKKLLKSGAKQMGYTITKNQNASAPPLKADGEITDFIRFIKSSNLSMTSENTLLYTHSACLHVLNGKIAGNFVECGVWRGGNSLLAAKIFEKYQSDKEVYMFDTFSGMTEPGEYDVPIKTDDRPIELHEVRRREGFNTWNFASLSEVKQVFEREYLLSKNTKFIEGDVKETLSHEENLPEKISVLRLDTDWYESTKLELDILYPRLSIGGVLIIDDYDYWPGCKKAFDEYFIQHGNQPFLQYVDDSCYAGVKYS